MQGWEQGSVLVASAGLGRCVGHCFVFVIWISMGVSGCLGRVCVDICGGTCRWVGMGICVSGWPVQYNCVCLCLCVGILGGSILGEDWCVSVSVPVFGWGALNVCVGAGDLWGMSVFVRVGGSLVRECGCIWGQMGGWILCVREWVCTHIRAGGSVQCVSV